MYKKKKRTPEEERKLLISVSCRTSCAKKRIQIVYINFIHVHFHLWVLPSTPPTLTLLSLSLSSAFTLKCCYIDNLELSAGRYKQCKSVYETLQLRGEVYVIFFEYPSYLQRGKFVHRCRFGYESVKKKKKKRKTRRARVKDKIERKKVSCN